MASKAVGTCALGLAAALGLGGGAAAQVDPLSGAWQKADPALVRVMTWNVRDGLCSTASKQEGLGSWAALARIVAALRPDVLLLQEVGDNAGHGTGAGADTVEDLAVTLDLFLHGGVDPFRDDEAVTAWVGAHAPGYDLPHLRIGGESDGFNRNAILSRWPFADVNGDGRATHDDLPPMAPFAYAPGGDGILRGFLHVEIDLPDADHAGDLVVGNLHLKAGSDVEDEVARLTAARNVAYYVDAIYGGSGTGVPDPFGVVADDPPVPHLPSSATPVVVGGDFNHDEWAEPGKGPVQWLVEAAYPGDGIDGIDRDRGDAAHDLARDPASGSMATRGDAKLDHVAWQDSIAVASSAFVFDAMTLPAAGWPAELAGFAVSPAVASHVASDHRPVVVDLRLPPSRWTDLGHALPGSAGPPRLQGTGTLAAGEPAAVVLDGAAPCSAAWFAIGGAALHLEPFLGGVLVPDAFAPPGGAALLTTDGLGGAAIAATWPAGVPPGLEVYVQAWIADAGAPWGWAASNAILGLAP